MSSIKAVSSGIGSGGVLHSGAVALLDFISSANAKGIGAIFERKDRKPSEHYAQVLRDEGLEPLWETFFCSMFTKAAKILTPRVPEQISIIPGKLLGAAWHWCITDQQSINKQPINNGGFKDNFYATFYNACVKGPSEFMLNFCGLGGEKPSPIRYALSQLGIFGLGSLALRNSTDENLPGVNIDSDESVMKNALRGVGYTIVEQGTYALSQTVRNCINFREEFGGKDAKLFNRKVIAKAAANVVNERFFPGHILAGITAALTTYCFGKKIPKTTAAAIGEFPMMLLNRIVNCHKRRATKHSLDENGNKVKNWRFNDSKLFERFLGFCDGCLNPLRNTLTEGISAIFNVSKEELTKSHDIDLPKIQNTNSNIILIKQPDVVTA